MRTYIPNLLLKLIVISHHSTIFKRNTVDSRYLELQGTLKNTSRYPYFDISDLQT